MNAPTHDTAEIEAIHPDPTEQMPALKPAKPRHPSLRETVPSPHPRKVRTPASKSTKRVVYAAAVVVWLVFGVVCALNYRNPFTSLAFGAGGWTLMIVTVTTIFGRIRYRRRSGL